MKGRILVVDDDQAMCDALELGLGKRGYHVRSVLSADEAMALVDEDDFDVVVTDLNLQGANGLSLCARLSEKLPDIPVIVITAFGSMESAITAVRAGAYDFITKPLDVESLGLALERAIQHRALRREVRRLREAVHEAGHFDEILGASPAMAEVYSLLERVAPSNTSILIAGESGTGKEMVARSIHKRSRRAAGPFVAINCAAMPAGLLESELFGHVKGAFTDARTAKTGLFVKASGGTIFLDEIGEMPVELQPKLLRALQERKVRPVGGENEVPFDARVVAASNRDLEGAVADRTFREDLYFRVAVITVSLPPLRSRGRDILLLAQNFLEQFAAVAEKDITGIASPAAEKLLSYSWPGNVRELRNCIERAVALTRYDQITVDDLPEKIRHYRPSYILVASENPSELVPLEEVERRYIVRVLKAVGGSRTDAARILGLDRKTLYRKLERYGVAQARGNTQTN